MTKNLDWLNREYCTAIELHRDGELHVWRTNKARIMIQKHTIWRCGGECHSYWTPIKSLGDGPPYYFNQRGRKARLAWNREMTARGKAWIDRYNLLRTSKLWEVMCDDWDGLGTPCPIQQQTPDGPRCPIIFSFHGYGGSYPASSPLPGKCPGPLNYSYDPNRAVPSGDDCYGFSMLDLARIRYLIWKGTTPNE